MHDSSSATSTSAPYLSFYEQTERKSLSNLFDRFRLLKTTRSTPSINHQLTDRRCQLIVYVLEQQQQQSNGLWLFFNDLLNLLKINKSRSDFQLPLDYIITNDMFITALIIVRFEQQYSIEKMLWISNGNKAKECLFELLTSTNVNEKHNQLEIILNELRKQI